MNTLFILSAFAYENYYAVPGLARSLFNDAHYEVARKVYARKPVEAADIPTDLHALIRAEYFDPTFFAASAYGRLLAANLTLAVLIAGCVTVLNLLHAIVLHFS